MSKVLITATNAMVYHFLVPHIKRLTEEGHSVVLACTNLEGYDELLRTKIDVKTVPLFYIRLNRSPYKLSNLAGIHELISIIDAGNYDLIWTNEPVMGIATRLAAKKAKQHGTKVLYMVHGFHFFKGSSLFSWIIYYPIERIMAHYAHILVTINQEDYKRGRTFAFQNVYYIHGIGLDTEKFKNVSASREKIRCDIGVPQDAVMIFSVGELAARKNHEVVIRALGKLKDNTIHYVICGEGVLEHKLKKLCKTLHIRTYVHFLGYRKDIAALCKAADIYVFPSKREGLGIGALEGMASGLPLISSNINGIRDYTEDYKTGITVNPFDINGYAKAIRYLKNNPYQRAVMGAYNQEIVKKYDIRNVRKELASIFNTELKQNLG